MREYLEYGVREVWVVYYMSDEVWDCRIECVVFMEKGRSSEDNDGHAVQEMYESMREKARFQMVPYKLS